MCQYSFAFNIKGQINSYSDSVQVSMADGNQNSIVTVKTKNIKEIERGGTRNFLNILGQSYGAKSQFQKCKNFNGNFNVTSYYPCQPLTPCGGDLAGNYPGVIFPIPGGNKSGVGASLSVDYERSRQSILDFRF
jgi:hypothetical protein